MFICDGFFKLETSGADSQVGVLIHGSSHFTAHGGSGDYFSKESCEQRAIARPDLAVTNAACYRGFAENDPTLP